MVELNRKFYDELKSDETVISLNYILVQTVASGSAFLSYVSNFTKPVIFIFDIILLFYLNIG
jgi:hypothetical protein